MKHHVPYFEVPTPAKLRRLRLFLLGFNLLCLVNTICCFILGYNGKSGAWTVLVLVVVCAAISWLAWPDKKEMDNSKKHWSQPRVAPKVTIWLKEQLN